MLLCLKVFTCVLMIDPKILKNQDLSAERDSVANASMDEMAELGIDLSFPSLKA